MDGLELSRYYGNVAVENLRLKYLRYKAKVKGIVFKWEKLQLPPVNKGRLRSKINQEYARTHARTHTHTHHVRTHAHRCMHARRHTHTHTHTHARTHARTHAHTHARAHTHTHTHGRTHARTHARAHTHHTRTCARTHTHTRTHVRARAYTHTHTHTHTHTQPILHVQIWWPNEDSTTSDDALIMCTFRHTPTALSAGLRGRQSAAASVQETAETRAVCSTKDRRSKLSTACGQQKLTTIYSQHVQSASRRRSSHWPAKHSGLVSASHTIRQLAARASVSLPRARVRPSSVSVSSQQCQQSGTRDGDI